jgi:hypothetical protein
MSIFEQLKRILFNDYPDFNEKYSSIDVAKYIIRKCILDGKPINAIHLQHIMYRLQAHFLQVERYALFDENFLARITGPVLDNVARRYCGYGAVNIYEDDMPDVEPTKREQEVIDGIIEKERKVRTEDIVRFNYKSAPWNVVWHPDKGDYQVISKVLIENYA